MAGETGHEPGGPGGGSSGAGAWGSGGGVWGGGEVDRSASSGHGESNSSSFPPDSGKILLLFWHTLAHTHSHTDKRIHATTHTH